MAEDKITALDLALGTEEGNKYKIKSNKETKKDLVRSIGTEKLKPKRMSKKMKRLNLQVTPEEYALIKEIAEYNGITISTLLRNSALGRGRILRKLD